MLLNPGRFILSAHLSKPTPVLSAPYSERFNHFTVPVCINFRAERCTDAPANSVFPVLQHDTSTFNAMNMDENPFMGQCEKEEKMA